MDALGTALLALIAVLSIVQTVALALLLREGRRTARHLDAAALRLGRDLAPVLEEANRALRNVGEVSELTAEQARRLDVLMGEASHALGTARSILEDVVLPITGRAAAVAAAVRLITRTRRFYHRFRRRRSPAIHSTAN
jgi:hypothetical protein